MVALSGLRLERARASKQFHEGRFHNTSRLGPRLQGSFGRVIGEFLFGGHKRKPPGVIPVESPLEGWSRPVESGLRITWLGHSTTLIESDGQRILLDPVFGQRVSPVFFAGSKRFHPAPVRIDDLPPLDAVLVSHDHYDHLCRSSIQALAQRRVPMITGLGVGARLESFGVGPELITELDWWEEHVLPGGQLSFTATPAQHFSGRSLTDENRTLWASWVITTDRRRVFFSGDTGLTSEFSDVAARFAPFDAVLLEVGAFDPAWGSIHLGPENALNAFDLLGGGSLLPVHWATFDLALHPWAEPAETLFELAQTRGTRILTPRLGAPFEPAHCERPEPWWRSVTQAASLPNETVTALDTKSVPVGAMSPID